jgi:hypothetical protein
VVVLFVTQKRFKALVVRVSSSLLINNAREKHNKNREGEIAEVVF